MSDLIFVPYEGCSWTEVQVMDENSFHAVMAAPVRPCAVGFACDWVGEGEFRRPVGWVYDFVIERRWSDVSPWRRIG